MEKTALSPPIKVSLVALPETTPATLYGLYEVLSSVGVNWTEMTGQGEGQPLLDVQIVSENSDTFASALGTPITPHTSLRHVNRTDILITTDLALTPDRDLTQGWPTVADWIRQQYDQGATVCSVCTGTVLLAAAGLLDGLEATTHWVAADLLKSQFPEVRLTPERILVPSGPDHRVITAGGSASWEELALYLIARYCGTAEAIQTAKVFLLGDRSEGQLLFASLLQPKQHDDAVIAECQSWLAMNYHEPNPVSRMISRSGLTDRTFKRRFRAATGHSPMDYVQTLRVEEAKQALESDDIPIDDIAYSIGYQDPAFFRRLFKKRTGVTPGRYRQRYRSVIRYSRDS